ncbi:bifunctional oligoribonuclease/PAP phosphatase NrnA [Mycoplasmatota bacterium WC30]
MQKEILKLIEKYDSIIIARHKNPDFDAYGSQFGLYYALKEFYPNKKIYVVGDTNPMNQFKDLDIVGEDVFKKSLLFILDTVASQMLDSSIYKDYSRLVLIDHHKNNPDIDYDIAYQIKDASSSSEIIASLLLEWDIPINKESARALYLGIIGDTGRFMYNTTTEKTFYIASKLMSKGIDIAKIHNSIYLEPKRNKEIKNIFFNNVNYTKNNVAYSKNNLEFLEKNDLTTNYVSRGLVNQMAGMSEVKIWINFTEDIDSKKIICEIRSREIPVFDIAKKYGGGGHINACGCTLDSWEDTDKVLYDLDNLLEENK